MKFEFQKSCFGYNQDCLVELENKSDAAYVYINKAEYPTIIKEDIIAYIINRNRPNSYTPWVTYKMEFKNAANGWMKEEIEYLEKRLEDLKFIQKIARRNKFVFVDKTGEQQCLMN